MFLDDELLEIGRKAILTDEGIKQAIHKMMKVCFISIDKGLGNKTDQMFIANFKRVNNTWKSVANTLIDEERGFIKKDGFEQFVKSKDILKGLF